jgi:CheY-like chemotaxis protein
VGKGTGLGLATVYGIVKQNNGFISVHSEPGKGATFKIYLPRFDTGSIETEVKVRQDLQPRGTATVLIVEDEPSILEIGKAMLERLGYTVISAGSPHEAIRIADKHSGIVHLLLTDVVMPEMNGRELADRLKSFYPDLKCLYMSGYTADVIAHHGVLNKGVIFIQKPFSLRDLAEKTRDALKHT